MATVYFEEKISCSFGEISILVGSRQTTQEQVQASFKVPGIYFPKQTHSTTLIEVKDWTDAKQEGDAVWTTRQNVPLGIVTADCIPLVLFSETRPLVAVCHAGWRGLKNGIVKNLVHHLVAKGFCSPGQLMFFIGPHIQQESFEVEINIAQEILASANKCSWDLATRPSREGRVLLDLNYVLFQQLKDLLVPQKNIQKIEGNTFTDPRLASYRRDGSNAGRIMTVVNLAR